MWFGYRLAQFELQSVDLYNALPLLLVLGNRSSFVGFKLHLDHAQWFVFFKLRLHYSWLDWITCDGRILGAQILD
jgi:hypothetical protein